MADFYFLENLAIKIQENRKKLEALDKRLSDLNVRLHEIPIHRNTESSFAKLTGSTYDDKFSELEKAKNDLETQKNELEKFTEDHIESFIGTITSEEFVIPLDPKFTITEGKTVYKYKNGEKFDNAFKILAELLGLSIPLVIKDVMLTPTEIVISERDEFDAKQKFVNIFSEVQNTLLIKKRN
jgi:hypothetical protein